MKVESFWLLFLELEPCKLSEVNDGGGGRDFEMYFGSEIFQLLLFCLEYVGTVSINKLSENCSNIGSFLRCLMHST